MLGEDTNLPEWVASKITLAEDYIVSAAQYMQSEMNEENLSELKRSTLAKYTKDAAMDMADAGAKMVYKNMKARPGFPFKANVSKEVKRFQKRQKGIAQATEKLGKD